MPADGQTSGGPIGNRRTSILWWTTSTIFEAIAKARSSLSTSTNPEADERLLGPGERPVGRNGAPLMNRTVLA